MEAFRLETSVFTLFPGLTPITSTDKTLGMRVYSHQFLDERDFQMSKR